MRPIPNLRRRVLLRVEGAGIVEVIGETPEEAYQDFKRKMDEMDEGERKVSIWSPEHIRVAIKEFFEKKSKERAVVC